MVAAERFMSGTCTWLSEFALTAQADFLSLKLAALTRASSGSNFPGRGCETARSRASVRRPIIRLNVGRVKRTTARSWTCRHQWWRGSARTSSGLRTPQHNSLFETTVLICRWQDCPQPVSRCLTREGWTRRSAAPIQPRPG